MKFFEGFIKGFINCFSSFEVLFKKGLWPFLIYPIAIWVFTWILTLFGITIFADWFAGWTAKALEFEKIPDSGHWLSFAKPFLTGYFSFFVFWVVKILFWFISGTFSKYVLLIVLSPLFALLSEMADEKLTGQKFPFSLPQLLKDILRGIMISLRNMFIEFGIIIGCFIITLIFPPMIIATTPLLLIVSWYFTGFSLMDYNTERYRYKVSDSVRFIRNNKGLTIGIGCVYWLFMSIPTFVGDITGLMFGPAVAALGATLSFLELNSNNPKSLRDKCQIGA